MEVILTMEEQSQILKRVRQRLQGIGQKERRVRLRRWPMKIMIAALLVVVLIGAWQVFRTFNTISSTAGTAGAPLSTQGEPAGPVNFKTMVNVHTSAGGLDAAFQITPGPYFISQLLQVKMTLTNHSQQAVQIEGGSCGSGPLWIDQSSGTDPKYQLLLRQIAVSCPGPMPASLAPGHTITDQDYIVLGSSSAVTLTENASFVTTTTQIEHGQQIKSFASGKSLLAGHWPTLHIDVASQIPADRVLTLQASGGSAIVTGPENVLSHLIYKDTYTCDDGRTDGAQLMWTPMTRTVLHAPGCPATWTYVVGAPGYAIASGRSGL
jgi:hypothetical protein